jgi:endonuclease/exonuclease/phosphatase family metal-dependent hydrolase
VLTVANFNMHAGVDGWGRPFDFLSACRQIDADVLVLEETWTGDADRGGGAGGVGGVGGGGQSEQIAHALGYAVVECILAEGRRSRPDPRATARWLPRLAFARKGHALFFDLHRPLPTAIKNSARYVEGEEGHWGIAVLVRNGITIEDSRILHLPTLSRDKVRRAAIVVDISVDGVALSVVGTHMSHIVYGSHRHYWALQALLRTEARPNAVLLGDMNLWGPPVRAYMRGWHRAVRGRTWPSWNPHSQIDHILVRGAIGASGEVLADAGSDHLPVRATLTFG